MQCLNIQFRFLNRAALALGIAVTSLGVTRAQQFRPVAEDLRQSPQIVDQPQDDAQDQTETGTQEEGQRFRFVDVDNPSDQVLISHPQQEHWQFGLEITATGNVRGLSASVPIPSDFPEQKLVDGQPESTANVGKTEIRELGPGARQLEFKIDRMASGDTAKVVFDVVIEKSVIIAPSQTDQFRFAEELSRELRSYLSPSPYIESRDRRIIRLAKDLDIDENLSAWEQVESIYKWVRENVEYEFDPKIHSCIHALETGKGDCEEMSSLFIAICRARKIPARAVWIPDHTYPEFYLEDAAGQGHWIPCQVAGNYAFGSMIEYRPVLQKGDRFRVPGHRELLRYVQPTLTARDAESAPTLKWIMTRID